MVEACTAVAVVMPSSGRWPRMNGSPKIYANSHKFFCGEWISNREWTRMNANARLRLAFGGGALRLLREFAKICGSSLLVAADRQSRKRVLHKKK